MNEKDSRGDAERSALAALQQEIEKLQTPKREAADDLYAALIIAEKEMTHEPDYCYATGPLTGDPIQDLVVCPGCAALNKMRAAIAKAEGRS